MQEHCGIVLVGTLHLDCVIHVCLWYVYVVDLDGSPHNSVYIMSVCQLCEYYGNRVQSQARLSFNDCPLNQFSCAKDIRSLNIYFCIALD